MTLDKYAEVELDDVKREFAKLDLCAAPVPRPGSLAVELISELKKHAPCGRERAWETVLQGLMELIESTTGRAVPESSTKAGD